MDLFKEYQYIPFIKSNRHLDNIISSKDYKNYYIDFKKCIDKINKIIEDKFFKNKFKYASKRFIIVEPHLIAFNLFIKSLTLQKIINNHPSKEIVLKIFDEETQQIELDRFTNHYFLLAKKIGNPFKIINKGKINVTYNNNPSTKNQLLNILNFNYKILFFDLKKRIFKNLFKKKILKIGQNYITREIEYELFKKGIGMISKKSDLKKFFETELKIELYKYDYIKSIIEIVYSSTNSLKTKYFSNQKVYEGLVEVLSDLININLVNLLSKKDAMRERIAYLKKNLDYKICLSNGLYGIFGKSLYDALHFNGIKVFSAEHGLTAGNSKDAIQSFYVNESLTSDVLFCYSNSSKKTRLKNKNSNLSIFVAGCPNFPKKIRFKKLKKFLVKKRLNLKGINIFYVSHNIEFNTEKYFPYTKSNSQIFNDELNLLSILGRINKNVIYKPYPTKQFLHDKFSLIKNYLSNYNNIKTFYGEEDYRYIRSASDIIITQSSESTLEWCMGVDVPLIFLDSNYYEPLENDSVKKIFEESFFVFNYDNKGWEKDLIDFLNMPYNKIVKLWKNKAKYRRKYDEDHFLSLDKYAGKIGSNQILNSISNL